MRQQSETGTVKRHKHTFHGLYYHLGRYGPQDVHVHPCWDEDCDRALIGEGRSCSGENADHHRATLPLTDAVRQRLRDRENA